MSSRCHRLLLSCCVGWIALVSSGCQSIVPTFYQVDRPQGNRLDPDQLAQIDVGLTRAQVRDLLGSPAIQSPFRTERWDYFYRLQRSGEIREQRQLTLYFNGDRLERIVGDFTDQLTLRGEDTAATP